MQSKKNKPASSLNPTAPREDDVRGYAYHLYEQSGRLPGHDLDNWLEAIACLSSRIPRDCSHRRLHRYLSESQGGKSRPGSADQGPGRPPDRAGPTAKLARKRK